MKKYVIILLLILIIISILLRIDVDSEIWNALIPIFFIVLVIYAGVKGLQLEMKSFKNNLK